MIEKAVWKNMWIVPENTMLSELFQSALLIEKPWKLTAMEYDEEQSYVKRLGCES